MEKHAHLDRGKLKCASECLCGMVTSSSQNDNLSFEEFQIAYEIPLPTNTFYMYVLIAPCIKDNPDLESGKFLLGNPESSVLECARER